ncbi:MAG TPA: hypothetical protein DDW73_02355 [Rhizobium sp.]|nr:hypothetical protein [Rhizobium sp.]
MIIFIKAVDIVNRICLFSVEIINKPSFLFLECVCFYIVLRCLPAEGTRNILRNLSIDLHLANLDKCIARKVVREFIQIWQCCEAPAWVILISNFQNTHFSILLFGAIWFLDGSFPS